jgi:hypothetical protein
VREQCSLRLSSTLSFKQCNVSPIACRHDSHDPDGQGSDDELQAELEAKYGISASDLVNMSYATTLHDSRLGDSYAGDVSSSTLTAKWGRSALLRNRLASG